MNLGNVILSGKKSEKGYISLSCWEISKTKYWFWGINTVGIKTVQQNW